MDLWVKIILSQIQLTAWFTLHRRLCVFKSRNMMWLLKCHAEALQLFVRRGQACFRTLMQHRQTCQILCRLISTKLLAGDANFNFASSMDDRLKILFCWRNKWLSFNILSIILLIKCVLLSLTVMLWSFIYNKRWNVVFARGQRSLQELGGSYHMINTKLHQ